LARRTIIIGDVHGCIDELHALLRACAVTPDDEVILAGDLVAKGPDSRAVVQLARERRFTAVLGNHDAHVLRKRDAGKQVSAAHQSVIDVLKDEDWRYLEGLPKFLRRPELGLIVVHAGIVPSTPLEEQDAHDLLHIRSLKADGRPSNRVTGGVPWATQWHGPELIVFGHDAIRGLQQHPHATGLDTGCVYGQTLTALVLPERRLVSVPARRPYAGLDGA
jgi:hypothetical protein